MCLRSGCQLKWTTVKRKQSIVKGRSPTATLLVHHALGLILSPPYSWVARAPHSPSGLPGHTSRSPTPINTRYHAMRVYIHSAATRLIATPMLKRILARIHYQATPALDWGHSEGRLHPLARCLSSQPVCFESTSIPFPHAGDAFHHTV